LDKKLKILFLCGWYPSRVLPNNGDFIQRHAKAVSLLHTVEVIHIVSDKNCRENIEITTRKIDGIITHIGYIKQTKSPILKCILFWKTYLLLLKKTKRFDVVHLNELYPFGIFALHLKWFQRKPFIISEHWTIYHKPHHKNISYIQKIISRIIVKKAAVVCPVSNNLKESMQLIKLRGNYNRVPNVVDTSVFYPREKNNDIFTLIHVSNMDNNHKNIEGIIRVIKKLESKIDDFRFKLIGENSGKYIPFAKKTGLNLNKTLFIDQMPHEEIAHNLKESNLFILFSNYENLPCVILEAFSCGIPVIATNTGGISEFFPSDFGCLIEANDELLLEKKILEMYTNFTTKKPKMHNYVEANFSELKIAEDFSKLYKLSKKTKR
jgi:glycosyltransferase involved in cell wall biosynthesis